MLATHQIAALPDSPAPVDANGQPAGPADPGKARETAGALLKIANGFDPDQLTASEQARLKATKAQPALIRDAPDGSTILTDTGRKMLTGSAPAAAPFVPTTEAQDLRTLSQPPPAPPAVDSTAQSAPAAPEATQGASPVDLSTAGASIEPDLSADQPPPTPRPGDRSVPPQPTTPRGQEALRRITRLEEMREDAWSVGTDLTDGQKATLAGARQALAEELARQGDALPPEPPQASAQPQTRQPTTEMGQNAARTLEGLASIEQRTGTLNDVQRAAREEAQRTLDMDLNVQVLGNNPYPVTERGKSALRDYLALTKARDSGVYMSRGDHEAIANAVRTVQDDFTAQRKAFDEQRASSPAPAAQQHLYTDRGRNSRAMIAKLEEMQREQRAKGLDLAPGQQKRMGELRAILAEELARPAPDNLAVGDKIAGGSRQYTVSGLGDERHVEVTTENGAVHKMPRADALRQRVGPDAPPKFVRPSQGAVTRQSQLTRALEKAARANPDAPGLAERYQAAVSDLAEMQRKRAMPLQPGETPRTFKMPAAPGGNPDVLDHIAEQGGMVSPKDARAKATYDPRQGDYDGAPDLKGFYRHSIYGGRMMPDRMAQILHENYGVGDGSADAMWKAISQAKELRAKVSAQQQNHALAQKQTDRFARDTATPKEGAKEVSAGSLNVGDKVKIGNQTLKVAAVDPDSLDVTLEDHSKYGVQTVADGQALYVEQVQHGAGNDGDRLGAARPDTGTGRLFGDDEPFELRPGAASDAERLASARGEADLFTPRPAEPGPGSMGQVEDATTAPQAESATAEPPIGQGATAESAPAASQPEMLDTPAPVEKPETDIADFGEKIGGARKDTARPLGSREKVAAPAANADQPAWRRKYIIANELKRDYATRTDKPTGQFVVARADGAHVRSPRFASAEEADSAIPLIEAARNHGVSYGKKDDGSTDWHIYRKVGENKRPVVKSGFASHEDATTYLASHPQEIIEHKFAFPERPWVDRLERTGGTERTGNVTPKSFQDAFGFRGGEFGNWNMGGDGQAALNHAYDALHDLADTLGVSPKALSLNGELGIAFGARGHGGVDAAAAHYEPGYQVINMTKIKGAGSLAHEWFHALDHYLGRQDGKATDRTQADDAREASGRDPHYVRSEYASHGFSRQSGTREELRKAFQGVIDATVARKGEFTVPGNKLAEIQGKQQQYVRDTLKNLRDQFTTLHEYSRSKTPATPEQLAEFDRLAEQIATGDVGERIHVAPNNGRRMSAGRWSHQPIEDLNALYKKVLGRSFATNDEGSIGRKLYWQVDAMKDAQKRVANAGGEGGTETQTRNVATDFLREARKIDNHRASDYWSTTPRDGRTLVRELRG